MTLIASLRRMTGASTDSINIGGADHWSDADLQEILDGRVSTRLIQYPVELFGTVDPDGRLVSKTGRLPIQGTLDTTSVTVVSFTGQAIATGYTLHDDGRIEFTTDQLAIGPLVSGLAYDLNGAAADLLTEWASAVKLGYDVETDGQKMSASQKHAQLLEQAKAFRARALPATARMVRGDVHPTSPSGTRASKAYRSWKRWGRVQ